MDCPQSQSGEDGEEKKSLPLQRIEPWSSRLFLIHYTDQAVLAPDNLEGNA
jgi:hypothetical protein